MNILILGAGSRIAEHTARSLIGTFRNESLRFLLVGRNATQLDAIAADLTASGAGRVVADTFIADLADTSSAGRQVAQCQVRLGTIDLALIAHGSLPDQAQAEKDERLASETLVVNGLSPVLLAERIVDQMVSRGSGTLVVIGSVAGDRGRRSNYLYGAAKGLVDRHVEGLRHRLYGSGVHAMLVKPGPTKTPMTADLGVPESRLASAEKVAMDIVHGIRRKRSVVYAPGKWRLIMLIIRHLPEFVFNRLSI
nr:SDR family NAD(P)-dependent oxidoreductase [uncultured Cupriavidus sp.]